MKTLPTTPQNEVLLQMLQRGGVRFLLVGGLAVRFYDGTRETHDVDVLIEPTPENAGRMLEVLAGFGVRPDADAVGRIQPYGTQVPVKCAGFDADLLWEPTDRFAAEFAVGSDALVGAVPVRVASRELLLRRLARSREPKHVADALRLRELARDPLINVVEDGIKGDITYALGGRRFRSAVTLTFTGIDAMTFLGLPLGVERVRRPHFEAWCAQYIRFPGQHQLTPTDLYGARCGIVHTYGSTSELSRKGEARHVIYRYAQQREPVTFNPQISREMVIVGVEDLVAAFFAGVDRALFDLLASEERAERARKRLRLMYHLMPSADLRDEVVP